MNCVLMHHMMFLGLPKDEDRSEWPKFNELRQKLFCNSAVFKKGVKMMGYEPFPGNLKFPPTEILTV